MGDRRPVVLRDRHRRRGGRELLIERQVERHAAFIIRHVLDLRTVGGLVVRTDGRRGGVDLQRDGAADRAGGGIAADARGVARVVRRVRRPDVQRVNTVSQRQRPRVIGAGHGKACGSGICPGGVGQRIVDRHAEVFIQPRRLALRQADGQRRSGGVPAVCKRTDAFCDRRDVGRLANLGFEGRLLARDAGG